MDTNVQQSVPFFKVRDMEASLRFYVNGLGFTKTKQWIDDGRVRWCWLQLDGATLMLQEYRDLPDEKRGTGVAVYFTCRDALAIYRDIRARNVAARPPFVGNGMWVIELTDPDGYQLVFESQTDAHEESQYTGV